MLRKKKFKIFLMIVLSITVILLTGVLVFIVKSITPIKNIDISLNNPTNITKFYDINGEEIYDENITKNTYTKLSDVNIDTINAFISIEDKMFYKHNGINTKRMLKATYNNLINFDYVEGASTITQQLVKNKYLNNEKTMDRKIKEIYLSLKLEKTEDKNSILENYLNTIYYGNGAYGIYDASQTFFNKTPKELTLGESCIIAGCVKSPSTYSPINNLEKSIERRNLVLTELLKDEKITEEEYNIAINEVPIINNEIKKNSDDLYSEYVLDEASEILNTNKNNILNGEYKIYTYKDNHIQSIIEDEINNKENYHINEYGNIADSLAIVIDNKSFGVSAIAGKSDYNLLNIKRQPGSLIKPVFTYAPALEEGLVHTSSEILDEKINYDGYSPNNLGNKYYGYISIKDAVAKSLNIPAVKLTKELSIEKCKEYAEKCGIVFDDNDIGYALSLGGMTKGTTIKEITDAYSPFTNNGNYQNSAFISKIVNKYKVTIYERKMSEINVYNTDTTYLMTDTLKYSVKNGTSKKLSNFNFDIAGKTGTVAIKNTNYNTDAYSLAYTTDHTMTVWLGNYTMEPEYNLSGSNNGGTYATQIINNSFKEIYKDNIPDDFRMPSTVSYRPIDAKSLEINHQIYDGENLPERYRKYDYFSNRYIPTKQSELFSTITPFDLNITNYKNSCKIEFDTFDHIEYNLYKTVNGKNSLIKTIKNSNGNYEYIDTDIENNKKYSYYIIAINTINNKKFTTSPQNIFIEKKYDNLINYNNSSSWLFA